LTGKKIRTRKKRANVVDDAVHHVLPAPVSASTSHARHPPDVGANHALPRLVGVNSAGHHVGDQGHGKYQLCDLKVIKFSFQSFNNRYSIKLVPDTATCAIQ
jgi:hypothetical protein